MPARPPKAAAPSETSQVEQAGSEAELLPDPSRLSPSQARRRQRIVDEAYEMILESDGENVQIRDVAERAGVALGTAYRYFGSKDRLFAEAFEKWHDLQAAELTEIATKGKTNSDRLRLVATGLLDGHARQPQFSRIVRESLLATSDPMVVEILHRCDDRANQVFRAALHGIESRDADAIALLVGSWVNIARDRMAAGVVTLDELGRLISKAVRIVLEFRDPTLDGDRVSPTRRPGVRPQRSDAGPARA